MAGVGSHDAVLAPAALTVPEPIIRKPFDLGQLLVALDVAAAAAFPFTASDAPAGLVHLGAALFGGLSHVAPMCLHRFSAASLTVFPAPVWNVSPMRIITR
jgi:hypothetical protein